MSLVRYRHGHPNMFKMFFDDMNTKDSFFEQKRPTNYGALPASNIKETDKEFTIEMAVPGLEKSDFIISIDNLKLTVAVEKEDVESETSVNYHRKEFHYENFKRTFQLSKNVNLEEISAEYTQGLLALTLPKKMEAKKETVRHVKVG